MNNILALLPIALVVGCANTVTPNYDARFGDAVREARSAQAINPTPAPAITGMDGKAAREAMGRYNDSYKSPPPVVNVINIPGIAGTN